MQLQAIVCINGDIYESYYLPTLYGRRHAPKYCTFFDVNMKLTLILIYMISFLVDINHIVFWHSISVNALKYDT